MYKIIPLLLIVFSINTHAEVKRYISVKSFKQNNTVATFRTSFDQDRRVSCDIKAGNRSVSVTAFKIGRKTYQVFGVPKGKKKIKCFYRLK